MDNIINKVKNEYNSLCEPSKLYLFMQLIFFMILLISVKNKYYFKTIYLSVIIFWTYVYDALCKNDYKYLSWGLVLGIILGNVIVFLTTVCKKNKLI